MSSLVGHLHTLVKRAGFEVIPSPADRLLRLDPDVLIDVGANRGQFAEEARRRGFSGRIASFEPIPEAFVQLQEKANADGTWEAYNLALGAEEGEADLHVANRDASSSLRPPAEAMRDYAGFLSFESTRLVPVRRLDNLFDTLASPGERVVMKVDTQGYEEAVIEGAGLALDRIDAVLLELSFVPLYEGEPPADAVMAQMRMRGFVPAYLAPAYTESGTRRWVQADVLFLRTEHVGR